MFVKLWITTLHILLNTFMHAKFKFEGKKVFLVFESENVSKIFLNTITAPEFCNQSAVAPVEVRIIILSYTFQKPVLVFSIVLYDSCSFFYILALHENPKGWA